MGLHGCGDGVNGPNQTHQPAASNCREEINKLWEFCVWIGGLPQGPITSWIQFRVWRSVRWIWKILVEMKHCSSSSIKSCFFILIQKDEWNLIKYLFGKKKSWSSYPTALVSTTSTLQPFASNWKMHPGCTTRVQLFPSGSRKRQESVEEKKTNTHRKWEWKLSPFGRNFLFRWQSFPFEFL